MRAGSFFGLLGWEFRRFVLVVLALQFGLLGLVVLEFFGLGWPVLRALAGIVYLVFVPGLLVLRVMRFRRLGVVDGLVYSVGLSMAVLMFTGVFINAVSPFFGFVNPISENLIVVAVSVVVLALCLICSIGERYSSRVYFGLVGEGGSDDGGVQQHGAGVVGSSLPIVLFLGLVPLLAVVGACFVNYYDVNLFLMVLIVVLGLVPLLVVFGVIPRNLYPLAIFVVAFSLLFHNVLVSSFLWSWDVHHEYYLANMVLQGGHWDSGIQTNTNGMLSIVMLAPIFSLVTGMDLTWVFKIMYPFMFSFVPLGLFIVFRRQVGDKIAFLACFFFMSCIVFFTEMIGLSRQQMAELFMILILMCLVDKGMDKFRRSVLFILFAASLVVSHYGLSYIFMFMIIFSWVVLAFWDHPVVSGFNGRVRKFVSRYLSPGTGSVVVERRTVSLVYVALFLIFLLSWYMYASESSSLRSLVNMEDSVSSSVMDIIATSPTSGSIYSNDTMPQGLSMVMKTGISPLDVVRKYFNLACQFLIVVGLARCLIAGWLGLEKEYEAFSLFNLLICVAGLTVPFIASSLNTSRVYQISLIVLAPFCIIGGLTMLKIVGGLCELVWKFLGRTAGVSGIRKLFGTEGSLKVLCLVLIVFLLLNTGFVNEIIGDRVLSVSLGSERVKVAGIKEKASFYDSMNTFEQDVYSSKWLSKSVDLNEGAIISADYITGYPITSYGMMPDVYSPYFSMPESIRNRYYILGYANIIGKVLYEDGFGPYETEIFYELFCDNCEIYDNGGGEIFYYRT